MLKNQRKVKGRSIFKCTACTNNIIISQDEPGVIIRNNNSEVVDSFHYLSNSIGQSGSCFEATTDRVRAAWKNFHSLLPVLTNSGISLKLHLIGDEECVTNHKLLVFQINLRTQKTTQTSTKKTYLETMKT